MRAQPTTKQLIAMLYERLPELFERPQRTWVGLTDEDIKQAFYDFDDGRTQYIIAFARAIEAKLKEKNSDPLQR